jgi:secondary thiamine-phosphate synthase enzyme
LLTVSSRHRTDAIDITELVQERVTEAAVGDGLCTVYVAHTTAGVFINENADPDVLHDLLATLDHLVPWERNYRHAEGNAAAHIKASLVGTSQSIPVRANRLALSGAIEVGEENPLPAAERQVHVSVIGR